jgi:hypothetical protein
LGVECVDEPTDPETPSIQRVWGPIVVATFLFYLFSISATASFVAVVMQLFLVS